MDKTVAENRGIDEGLFHQTLAKLRDTPACQTMDIRVKYLGKGTAGLKMSVSHEFQNSQGLLHGGFIAALADTAMGYSIVTLGFRIVTLDLNLNYFAPALMGTELSAEANVLHVGKNTIVAEAALYNSDKKLVAKSRGTFFLSRSPETVKSSEF
jgi:uncharacterized protein (TIGR00369 family)